MFTIVEPQWGIDLLVSLNTWMMSSQTIIFWIPKLADLFVFTYPVFLVILYFRANLPQIAFRLPRFARNDRLQSRGVLYYKIAALFVGFSVLVAVVVNLLIQYIFVKVRPDVILWLIDKKTESILHNFLPSSSFPSDHAAVSMSVAMATLLWGIRKKDKRFVLISIPLFVFSLIMSFCRITGGIHRPTDIIAGSVIWIVVPLVLMVATNPYTKGTLPKIPHPEDTSHFLKGGKRGHKKFLERIFSRIGKII